MKVNVFFLITSMLLVTAGGFAIDKKQVKGNGKIVIKEISISDYDRISLLGSMNVEYEQSNAAPSFQIKVDENILEQLEIKVKDRTLIIRPKEKAKNSWINSGHYSLQPTVCLIKSNSSKLKELNINAGSKFEAKTPLVAEKMEINLAGGGHILFDKLEGQKMELNIAGGGLVKINDLYLNNLEGNIAGGGSAQLKGEAIEGELNIAGGGSIQAYGCKIRKAECNVSGGGTIEVYASEQLEANIIGGGNVTYKGNPKVEKNTMGGGSVKKNE